MLTVVAIYLINYRNVVRKQSLSTPVVISRKDFTRFHLARKWNRRSDVKEMLTEYVNQQGYPWFVIKSAYGTQQTCVVPKHWTLRILANASK